MNPDSPSQKAGLRVNITDDGKVVVLLNDESINLKSTEVDALIEILTTAKNDAKSLSEMDKKKRALTRNYNSVGRYITDLKNEKIF